MCFPFHTTQNMATSHVVLPVWGIDYIKLTITPTDLAHTGKVRGLLCKYFWENKNYNWTVL